MLYLSAYGATCEDVLHIITLVVIENTLVGMKEAPTVEAIHHTTFVLEGTPDEDLDAQGSQCLQSESPMGASIAPENRAPYQDLAE